MLYRTSDLFLRLFGLTTLDDLLPISAFEPPAELHEELRERLLRAGEARAGGMQGAPEQSATAEPTP